MPPSLIAGEPVLLAVLPLLPATSSLFVLLSLSILGLVGAALRLRPAAVKTLARIVWRQKPGLIVLAIFFAAGTLFWQRISLGTPSVRYTDEWKDVSWPMFRGSLSRSGHADSQPGPTTGAVQWTGAQGFQFYSSPTVAGNQILAVGSQQDSARIFCWDAKSGELQWTAAPHGLRATFSSAVIDDNYLVCGEGLHQTAKSRVLCIPLSHQAGADAVWEFSTSSHVECTPVLVKGRIFVNAGDDGVYCLEKPSTKEQQLQVVWHAPGQRFPDAETALAVHEERVYVGLGLGGEALCVLDAGTGREMKRLKMPYPVFSPPAISGGRIYVGMGRADYVTQQDGLPGEVRCIDLESLQTIWKVTAPAAVLAAIVVHEGEIIFNCVNGQLCVVDQQGNVKRQWNARTKVLTAPAVTDRMIYSVSCDGMLTALDRQLERVWTVRLGAAGNYISSPVVAHGYVFVGTPDDGFVCVGDRSDDKDRSSDLVTHQAGVALAEPIPPNVDVAWELSGPTDEISADISASPAISAHEFVAPMSAANWTGLVCGGLDRAGERRRWIWQSAQPIEVPPVISGDAVACIAGVESKAGELVALDRKSGRMLWRRTLAKAPSWLAADGESFFVVDDTFLCRLNLVGELLWRVPMSTAELPITIDGEMVIGCSAASRQLFALDRITGKALWQSELLDAAQQPPVVFDDLVLIAAADGLERRSLVDGSLQKSLSLGPTRHVIFQNQDRFIASTRTGELAFGSIQAGSVKRYAVGLNADVIPVVGTNAVVYATTDNRLLWRVLEEGANGKTWFSPGLSRRYTAAAVLSDGRAYVSISGQGLLCLESRAKAL